MARQTRKGEQMDTKEGGGAELKTIVRDMALGEVRDMALGKIENRGNTTHQKLEPWCKSGGRREIGAALQPVKMVLKSRKNP